MLERYSITSMGNMHSIKELTEFILQQTNFWGNICIITLLPLSRDTSVSKCIKGQCPQSADQCSISSKWQFRHLIFRNALLMSSTTLIPSVPTSKIGLPAEIEARQKQYEFYRDALLTYAATGKTILTDRQTDRQTDRRA